MSISCETTHYTLLFLGLDLDDLLLDHLLQQLPPGLLLVRARLGAGLAPRPRLGPAAALAAAAALPPPPPTSSTMKRKLSLMRASFKTVTLLRGRGCVGNVFTFQMPHEGFLLSWRHFLLP